MKIINADRLLEKIYYMKAGLSDAIRCSEDNIMEDALKPMRLGSYQTLCDIEAMIDELCLSESGTDGFSKKHIGAETVEAWIPGSGISNGEEEVYPTWTCPVCGDEFPTKENYCANCGTKMTEGTE